MSSFIVSYETMNNIINGLFWDHKFKEIHGYIIYKKLNLNKSEDYKRLIRDLYKLNFDAFNYRYSSKLSKNDLNFIKGFKWTDQKVNPFQFLKSCECLLYQCSEGNIIKRKLYKDFKILIECLKSYIIDSMPEYKKSTWD
tara:strand:- start:576 stop:995 length:420 start_codon:yes stop_codon:yes gene_type:complete